MVEKDTEQLWRQLLSFIEDGRVIPVIGPELLLHDIDGKTMLLYSYLAEQLAKRLQISSEPADTLNAVVCRYLCQGGEREDIYPEIKRAMPPLSQVKLPETLVKLAEIRPFKLFVTTSFDPLLVHALNQVRYGGLEKTQVLEFSLGSINDLPVTLKDLDRATVFHLFGKLTAVQGAIYLQRFSYRYPSACSVVNPQVDNAMLNYAYGVLLNPEMARREQYQLR